MSDVSLSPDDPKDKKTSVFGTNVTFSKTDILDRISYFSQWNRANRAIALCLKFKDLLVKRCKKLHLHFSPKENPDSNILRRHYLPLEVTDIQAAEKVIIKFVQRSFSLAILRTVSFCFVLFVNTWVYLEMNKTWFSRFKALSVRYRHSSLSIHFPPAYAVILF